MTVFSTDDYLTDAIHFKNKFNYWYWNTFLFLQTLHGFSTFSAGCDTLSKALEISTAVNIPPFLSLYFLFF
jgi:hypothetical protein